MIVAVGACGFDSSGQDAGGSASVADDGTEDHDGDDGDDDDDDATSVADTTTTTSDDDPSDTTKGPAATSTSSDSSDGDAESTTVLATTDTGAAIEVCNGMDDDDDGAVDEYSPMNSSCNGCEYQVTVSGWVQSHCTSPMAWPLAQAHCESLGATLAIADSEDVNAEVSASAVGAPAWIGLSDAADEGEWLWVDGSPVRFDAWAMNQPNDLGGEDCGLMHDNEPTWNDDECEATWPFICRAPQ
jgi:hypothetical protein